LGFADQEVLDVPGRPRVIHVPGHTAGNTALSLDDREVLIVGDTLSTLSLSRGEESEPQLLPPCMNEDHDRALASLEKIELINARWSARSRSSVGGKSAAGRQAGPAGRGQDKVRGLCCGCRQGCACPLPCARRGEQSRPCNP
jgi:glyoxylase-like metal-dependent hydrolase (beta-lactamase superfamily II)